MRCGSNDCRMREALVRIRALCVYPKPLIAEDDVAPRFVIMQGREIVRLVDEALGKE